MLEAVRRAARDWCDNRDLPGHQKHKTRLRIFSGRVATLAVIESLAYFVTDVNTDYLEYFSILSQALCARRQIRLDAQIAMIAGGCPDGRSRRIILKNCPSDKEPFARLHGPHAATMFSLA